MADKKTQLSIVLRTVDNATAKIKAISDRLDAITKPIRDFRKALGELREKSGLDDVIGGFKGVGGAVADLLGKLALVGGVVGVAVAGLMSLIDHFDAIGDMSEKVGVGVESLVQLRYAAARSGVATEKLDAGLANLSKNMGMLRAKGGDMMTFLGKVSPTLLKQVKATKSNEEAFTLLAGAMAKIEDPAKRAAFAQKTLGDASLAPLLAKGPKGIKELRDRYAELAGPQAGAVAAAGEFGDSMDDLKASTDGIKAALVEGLAPALKVIVEQLREWFTEHRGDIKEWAAALGKKIPGAVRTLQSAFMSIVDTIRPFVDSATKLKVLAVVLAGVIAGPLISSIVSLGIALMATPVGWIVAGIAAIAAGAYLLIDNWDAVSGFFVGLWDTVQEKFGWAADAIAAVMFPFIYFPAKIIANWDSITGFFGDVWDGVVGAFRKAIDWIVAKVDFLIGKIKAAKDWLTGDDDAEGKELLQAEAAQRTAFLTGSGNQGDADARVARARKAYDDSRLGSVVSKVIVDFNNAPRGTRATTDPQSTGDVDLSMGYQLLPGGL